MTTVQKLEERAKLEGRLEAARNLLASGVPLEVVLKSGVSLEDLKAAGLL